jgi:hypothetical protein
MQQIVDELAAAGRPIPEDEQVSYTLAGLVADYNSLVAALGVVTTTISLSDLYAHIHTYDERQLMLRGQPASDFDTSANLVNRQQQQRPRNFSNGRGAPRGDRRDDSRSYRRDEHR